MGYLPRDPWDAHGTEKGYAQGCRCDDCRAAHAARVRKSVRKRQTAACERCGESRVVNPSRGVQPLCRDCRVIMNGGGGGGRTLEPCVACGDLHPNRAGSTGLCWTCHLAKRRKQGVAA